MPIPIIVGCVGIAICFTLIAYALMPARGADSDAIGRRLDADDAGTAAKKASPKVQTRKNQMQLMSAFKRAAPRIAPPISDADQSRLRAKLSAAGIRSEGAPAIFLASKTVLGAGGAGLALLLTWTQNSATMHIFVITAFAGAIAFMLPDLYLAQTAAVRGDKIKKALADCLDMVVIMVESGLGIDGALQRVGIEMDKPYPELAEEFRIVNAEINMGLRRNDALQHLADRTGVREIQSLVATIIQSERFGSSIGKTLRIQSDTLRTKRQQAAEEAAGKTAVKLLFPLICFIFPALMIVVGAPAVLTLIEATSGVK